MVRTTTPFQPSQDAVPSMLQQFELDGAAGFLLYDDSPRLDPPPAHDVSDFDLHDITAAQLAVDGKIEQRPIP